MKKMIPHSCPWVTNSDVISVNRALKDRSVCNWRYVDILRDVLKKYSRFENCDLYSSGTLALRSTLLSLKLPKKSTIAVPSFTCKGVLDGVISAGYTPFIVDCDDSGLMRHDIALEAFLAKKVQACIAVHQFGLINNSLESLTKIMPVIEDCSHVPPQQYLRGSVGVFGSLEGTKLIGAGEGGYLLLKHKNKQEYANERKINLGDRLSDIMAVLALNQIKRLQDNIKIRQAIAERYKSVIGNVRFIDGNRSTWFRFLIRLDSLKSINKIITKANRLGITLKRPIMPIPLHRYVDKFKGQCPNADRLWETLISVPIYPDLAEKEINLITSFLKSEFLIY